MQLCDVGWARAFCKYGQEWAAYAEDQNMSVAINTSCRWLASPSLASIFEQKLLIDRIGPVDLGADVMRGFETSALKAKLAEQVKALQEAGMVEGVSLSETVRAMEIQKSKLLQQAKTPEQDVQAMLSQLQTQKVHGRFFDSGGGDGGGGDANVGASH